MPYEALSRDYAQKLIFVSFCFIDKTIWLKKVGHMISFRLLVGIGRSGVMIGRICLSMVSQLLDGVQL